MLVFNYIHLYLYLHLLKKETHTCAIVSIPSSSVKIYYMFKTTTIQTHSTRFLPYEIPFLESNLSGEFFDVS